MYPYQPGFKSYTNSNTSMEGKKTILITGCSPGGIGHALARAFNASGLHVFATARNAKALEDLRSLGIEALSLEVTSTEDITKVKEYVIERTGGSLDYLANNAGINLTVPALDVDLAEVRNVFNTNIIAVIELCQAFAPLLLQAKGTIINIGSVAGEIPYVYGSVYNATKAALHAYSDTLRIELAPFGVSVMVVVTGGVKSNIVRRVRPLPADSIYLHLKEGYEARQLHPQVDATDTTAFAETIVTAALKNKPVRSLWQGNQAGRIWLILTFLPRAFWDYYFTRMFGLNNLATVTSSERKDL